MLGVGVGTGVAVGHQQGSASPSAVNPNLLRWTEEMDNTAWTIANASVAADQDGTYDEITCAASGGALRQVTQTASSSGAAVTAAVSVSTFFSRPSVTGTFDGTAYTFAIDLRDASGDGFTGTLRLDRSGGFLRVSVEDTGGNADFMAGKAQLEVTATATAYQRRGGV